MASATGDILKDKDKEILAKLDQLGALGGARSAVEQITFAAGYQLPFEFKGNIRGAADHLYKIADEEDEVERFNKVFNYKPWDVAAAMVRVSENLFGLPITQRSSFFTMSGHREIPTGPNSTMLVPTGKLTLPTLKATMQISATEDQDGHANCTVFLDAFRKDIKKVQGIWLALDEELSKRSIYKGQAIDGSEVPNFLDIEKIDIEKIIYTKEVLRRLEANLWVPVVYPEVCLQLGIDPQRKVLLRGQFGTGKTLGAMWTAKLCVDHGRTFIMCNSKDNNIFECLALAAQYSPACLFVEDIDGITESSNRGTIRRVLEELDGFKSKGHNILMVVTTNRVESIHQGLLRPGRIDSIITIGEYDLDATVRYFRTQFSAEKIQNVDFVKVYQAMEGFTPAFTAEVCRKAKLYTAPGIVKGGLETYTTEDILLAVQEVREQHNLHKNAPDVREISPLEEGLTSIMESALNKSHVIDRENDFNAKIEVEAEKVS